MLQLNFLIEINLIYQQILLITKFEIILKMEIERLIISFWDCIVEMVKHYILGLYSRNVQKLYGSG
jgi:hypothetical protein